MRNSARSTAVQPSSRGNFAKLHRMMLFSFCVKFAALVLQPTHSVPFPLSRAAVATPLVAQLYLSLETPVGYTQDTCSLPFSRQLPDTNVSQLELPGNATKVHLARHMAACGADCLVFRPEEARQTTCRSERYSKGAGDIGPTYSYKYCVPEGLEGSRGPSQLNRNAGYVN